MRIQHNIPAMSSYRNYTNNVSALSRNLEKLSSGYKINRAGDDAAGLAISEKMRAQITGLEVAQKNAKDGISLVQTAEGALTEVHDMLNRAYELAEQSANGTYQDEVDREQLQKELDQLKTEINRIADSSNFNGIKLLDGSLDSGPKAITEINIDGKDAIVASTESEATKGKYVASEAFIPNTTTMAVGDTFTYSVGLSDGTSFSVTLTAKADKEGKVTLMTDEDGNEVTITEGKPQAAEISDTVLKQLQKKLGDKFTITDAAGKYTFENVEAGLDAPEVTSIDAKYVIGGKAEKASTDDKIGITSTQPLGKGIEIEADKITEYDGTNYDKAVFSINGHKFVLLSNTLDGKTTAANDSYLRAVQGLGSDVTILVGGRGGLKKEEPGVAAVTADTKNGNFNQNIAKIAEVTGLVVTDMVDESNFNGTTNNKDAGNGIRISIGKNSVAAGKGLTLQIGDTAEDFNQMVVSIGDCHTKAMGIADISIAKQDDAATAMDKIKDAINYVSDVRGTLGATQNRLDHTINNLSVMQENIQDAESTIRDVDVAKEMMEYTKNNILVQSAQAMLAQANQMPQGVLQLLQ